jgi:Ser/Thr protein kinase RdoA (MazF antagonist)
VSRIESLRQQIWPGTGTETSLAAHLERQYGEKVVTTESLDAGVFGVEWSNGKRWIARLFPAARPLFAVQGDAEVLQFLDKHEFPSERCAHSTSVSSMDGRGVLVTERVEGSNGRGARGVRLFRKLGELLGRLQSLPVGEGAVTRPAGAWHHLSFAGGGRRKDIEQLKELLADAREHALEREKMIYDALRDRVAKLDDCEDLPQSLIHPDFSTPNIMLTTDGSPVFIDWTGAGRGARILALGTLLNSAGQETKLVDAILAGYSEHIQLEPDEIERLPDAVRGFGLIVDAWTAVFMPKTVERVAKGRLAKWYVANLISTHAQKALSGKMGS